MFDETYIESLPVDPDKAWPVLVDGLLQYHANLPSGERVVNYVQYINALTLLRAFSETHDIKLKHLSLSEDLGANIGAIVSYFHNARVALAHAFSTGTLDKLKSAISVKYNKGFRYTFSDGDIDRIQQLINELRSEISATTALAPEHIARLMKRLERLQTELHKGMTDLDRFYGLLVDGSVVLKKVGENARPIIQRIQEVVNIVWRVQARAEELPSNMPLALPSDDQAQ